MNIQGMNIGNTFTNAARAGLGYVGAQDYVNDAKDVFLGKKERSFRSMGRLQRNTQNSSIFDRAAEVVNRDPAKYAHLAVCVTTAAIFFTGAPVSGGVCLALKLTSTGISLYRLRELRKSRPVEGFEQRLGTMPDVMKSLFNAAYYYDRSTFNLDPDNTDERQAHFYWNKAKRQFNGECNSRKNTRRLALRILAMDCLIGSMTVAMNLNG